MPGARWSWHGVAGVILSACIGIGWAVALIATSIQKGPVTDSGAQILNTIGGGLVGAVATWIGLAGGKKPADPDTDTETTITSHTEEHRPTSQATPNTIDGGTP